MNEEIAQRLQQLCRAELRSLGEAHTPQGNLRGVTVIVSTPDNTADDFFIATNESPGLLVALLCDVLLNVLPDLPDGLVCDGPLHRALLDVTAMVVKRLDSNN